MRAPLGAVGALVLAAGGSARLGQPKQLLTWEGETLIRRAVCSARAAGCAPVAVVLGASEKLVAAEIADLSAATVSNPGWERGLGSSIRRGVAYFAARAPSPDALVLLTCDQPFLEATVIANLIARWRETAATIVASRYAGTLGVPALFARDCFAELAALPDASGAKILWKKRGRVIVPVPFPKGVCDIDTMDDYARAQAEK